MGELALVEVKVSITGGVVDVAASAVGSAVGWGAHALTNAAWPFIAAVADHGFDAALAGLPALKRGVATHQGHVVNPTLAAHLGLPEVTL